MTPSELLKDAFTRVVESAERVVDGLSEDQLTARPGADANTIAWLVWHIARGEDAQIADVAGTEEVWTAQGFVDRFALPLDPSASGYGMTTEEVGEVRAGPDLLTDYLRATHAATLAYLDTVTDADLDRVVDERWNPPVTLGVRLVSVVNDATQHVGQAAYVRGLLG
ncbi:DUF664 domain-containing protein [Nocardioides sp. CER19]|uniref:mycothiol transferase n=1 Tax=Nocardioides sp. CER19 TaxID=3038538 RepID=UPI002448D61F|nr:DUF664 domain-containing protein [Nocardioides sp. CER19]MDH2412733.1 DinB family protein [Nocardioides sp. CER19]